MVAGYPLRSGVPDPAGCWFTTSGDLERKLIGLVVTVLSVVLLGHIVTWDGQGDVLGFGVDRRRHRRLDLSSSPSRARPTTMSKRPTRPTPS
jgi:hypothetical protein